MIKANLHIKRSEGKGRGVFTKEGIPSKTVIEISPVIVLSPTDTGKVDQTKLHNYIFLWGKNLTRTCLALGFCSVYNHSYEPNCEYEMDFDEETMRIITLRSIKKGEELFINYNGVIEDQSPLWFDVKRK
ncbi:MAG: SET domain-containing protein [Chitinophagaceae bacterium]